MTRTKVVYHNPVKKAELTLRFFRVGIQLGRLIEMVSADRRGYFAERNSTAPVSKS